MPKNMKIAVLLAFILVCARAQNYQQHLEHTIAECSRCLTIPPKTTKSPTIESGIQYKLPLIPFLSLRSTVTPRTSSSPTRISPRSFNSSLPPLPPTRPRSKFAVICSEGNRRLCTDGQLTGDLFLGSFLGPLSGTSGVGRGVFPSGNKRPSASSARQRQPCQNRFITDSNNRILAGACIPIRTLSTLSNSRFSRKKRQRMAQKVEYLMRPTSNFKARYLAQELNTATKRDLLILMDESGSVSSRNYPKVRRIAAAIVKSLCGNARVNPRHTRVAVMSFDSEIHTHVSLISPPAQRYLDYSGISLGNHIYHTLQYNTRSGKATCLIKALEHAYKVVLDRQNGGRRGAPDYVQQDIILISDGCANCDSNRHDRIRQITSFFMEQHINVYVIGIGVQEHCKQTLSLLAQGGRCYHFFYLNQWNYDVDQFIHNLENPFGGFCTSAFDHPNRVC